jgi:hypothetical protein
MKRYLKGSFFLCQILKETTQSYEMEVQTSCFQKKFMYHKIISVVSNSYHISHINNEFELFCKPFSD